MKSCKTKICPAVKGKFIVVGSKKLYIKGVTYGTFRPNREGELYPKPDVVARDFAMMASQGINSVRTYTVPPGWLLDLAAKHNLYVMVGLPWEQHIAFLDQKKRIQDIEKRVRAGVRACVGHQAILCYAIGNEIPAPIVRWYGRQRVENFLKRLYLTVKAEDSEALVTYVNYPSTEYLQLPFVDFVCFNVYLESRDRLEAYLARLHNIAGDRPLVMAEIGLDSLRNGEETQAKTLDWQIQTILAAGCAGCFVFAWTDEWYRGGFDIEDWDFGLTDRQRRPKPALSAVHQAFAAGPFPAYLPCPRISVAVCSYNGASTIRDTLEALQYLDYPNYEVIVVDDGSTDGVAAIAKEYKVRVIIHKQNRGLSSARNTALEAATGAIIAYIDDDAYPDPHWLTYLAATFLKGDWAGVGGPNIPPPGDGLIADCVSNAPGGPIHVLLSDQEAEHIPGCNMAYWKTHLQEIGGFDPRFRAAGDDVDICWRLQERGWKIGFSPSAVVWHHRRNSVKMYWKQQQGYGKAEALLEQKWPQKYNAAGHLNWSGRLYGKGLVQILGWRLSRIYHGTWGSALFQSVYQPAPGLFPALPTMPEWYLVILALAGLSSLGLLWKPMVWTVPFLLAAIAAPVTQAILSASKASFTTPVASRLPRFQLYSLTVLLYLLQPLARLKGRLDNGLTPWRRRGVSFLQFPRPRKDQIWSESWQSQEQWLERLEFGLREQGAVIYRGSDFDRWDLEVRGGLFGAVRILMTIEEHGGGKQLLRFRSWPRVAVPALIIKFLLLLLCAVAAFDQAGMASAILGTVAVLLLLANFQDCATAKASYLYVLRQLEGINLESATNNPTNSQQNKQAAIIGVEL
ncbi:MAG: glycosyltransferase [Moorea sp. SIO4E2]|uniref:glycosyltransferase n=1 Tax=Moorena sp. SIO4E2 TaxID=2607826 RepID=UPI0013BBDCFB|nr:glycosyltransferase [Moorena sp. SIO4E2]NEQ05175.1 glycosyltransferase [Moorena sp. SIO4E2]